MSLHFSINQLASQQVKNSKYKANKERISEKQEESQMNVNVDVKMKEKNNNLLCRSFHFIYIRLELPIIWPKES